MRCFSTAGTAGVNFAGFLCIAHVASFLFRILIGWDFSSSSILSIELALHLYLSPIGRGPTAAIWNLLTRDEPGEEPLHHELAAIIEEADFAAPYFCICVILFFSESIVRFFWNHVLVLTSMFAAFPVLLLVIAYTWLRSQSEDYQQHYEKFSIFEAVFAMFANGLNSMITARYELFLRILHFQREWFADRPPTLTTEQKLLFESTRSQDQFMYGPLDPQQKHLRLLRLAKRTPFSKPSFTLITVPMSRAPRYEAISYTWGGQGQDRFLELTGNQWIRATENVNKIAFQRASWKRTRHIWIDAVCINQSNDIERNNQVQLMSEIYGNAERVLVWLDDNVQRAGDATRLLSHMHHLKRIADDYDSFKPFLTNGIIPPGPHYHWPEFSNFFSHPYWSRTWIIQEISLGKVVHVFYGHQYISLNHIWEGMDLSEEAIKLMIMFGMREQGLDPMTTIEGANRFNVIVFCRNRLLANDPLPLGEALSVIHEFGATDNRDKVFGLYALVAEPERMSPDYRLSDQQVYLQVAHALLDMDPQTLFERAGLCFQRPVQLPSWVPDWSLMSRDTYESRISYAPKFKSYLAGGPGKSQITLDGVFKTRISIECVALSAVKQIGPSFSPLVNMDPLTEVKTVWDFFYASVRFLATGGRRNDVGEVLGLPSEAVWRTMLGDRERDEGLAVFPASTIYGEYFRLCHRVIFNDITSEGRAMMEVLAQEGTADMRKYVTSMSSALAGRKFAIAEDGTMMITPLSTQVGDHLVVVPGIAFPVLLRQKHVLEIKGQDIVEWELVGSCYAHGFMQGEALVRRKTEKIIV